MPPLSTYVRSNRRGLVQAVGVLAVATVTGSATAWLLFNHYWWLALALLVVHGNVFALMCSGLHELIHRSVFRWAWLNDAFAAVLGFLSYTSPAAYWRMHRSHHANALHDADEEIHLACRPLWLGAVVWNSTFNVPKFVFSAVTSPVRFWSHMALAALFLLAGWWPLVIVFTLGPFWFGQLEYLIVMTQHYGLPRNASINECTRSLRVPAWLSFLRWRMEYHVEHHHYPSVPCYWMAQLHRDRRDEFPPRQSLLEAWRVIMRPPPTGTCGHGPNPLLGLLRRLTGALPSS